MRELLRDACERALEMLGLGRERVERVPVDDQGRMRADALPALDDSTIVCIQAGNVNTGAFDPADEVCAAAREANAWVHVDGAFGMWALASPEKRELAARCGRGGTVWRVGRRCGSACRRGLRSTRPWSARSKLFCGRGPEHHRGSSKSVVRRIRCDGVLPTGV